MQAFKFLSIVFAGMITIAACEKTEETKPVEGTVDLGLPSGILWAECNLGASKPEECGNYYAWAETTVKTDYAWKTYKYCDKETEKLTKYCSLEKFGTVDNKTKLEDIDDAAIQNLGNGWRMPTKAEINELMANTTWTWDTSKSIPGYIVKSKLNDKELFFPAAGCYRSDQLSYYGTSGYYWASESNPEFCSFGWMIGFFKGAAKVGETNRYQGFSIRPVHK